MKQLIALFIHKVTETINNQYLNEHLIVFK